MDSCSCGCGEEVSKEGNKYILGHYAKLNPPMKNPEIARKSGKSKEGKPNFWKGKPRGLQTEDHKRKRFQKRKGKKLGPQTEEHKRKRSEKLKGKLLGSYLDRFGEEKTRKIIKKQRNWMIQNGTNVRKQIKNPSGSELKLRRIVKELYSTAEHTYSILNYNVDNAIVEHKIAIEYDGWFHFDTEEHKEYHKKRQQEIEEEGWKFLRYTIFDKLPTKEQVLEDIKKLVENVII